MKKKKSKPKVKKPSIKALREALAFYAEPRSWRFHMQEVLTGPFAGKMTATSLAYTDQGAKARVALGMPAKVMKELKTSTEAAS